MDPQFGRLRTWLAGITLWPLCRLAGVLLMFGLIAHYRFGFSPGPFVRGLPIAAAEILAIASFLSLLSGWLGQWFLWLALWPLWFFVFFNDWYYRLARWLLVKVRPMSPRSAAVVAFAGELGLFLATFYGARSLGLRLGLNL